MCTLIIISRQFVSILNQTIPPGFNVWFIEPGVFEAYSLVITFYHCQEKKNEIIRNKDIQVSRRKNCPRFIFST